MGEVGLHVPRVNVKEVWPLYLCLHKAIQEGLLSSTHAVARGGLAVHLAMVAMGGELGMDIDLGGVPSPQALSDTQMLYSESAGRFVVTVDPAKKEAFEAVFSGMKAGFVGLVTGSRRFCIQGGKGGMIIDEGIFKLKDSWKRPFGGLI
jgi:phosphoribosylformylglycinamidine synthase